jgi:D-aminopeptidase
MPRARDLVAIGTLSAGRHNAITDVQGVRVGHATIRGDRACTGVTAIVPRDGNLFRDRITAGVSILNGYGKSAGLMQVEELGTIEAPIMITSTLNVPRVADAVIDYMLDQDPAIGTTDTVNAVVLECYDGYLNDAKARPVGAREVLAAINGARGGPVETGCVGAGTGMRCLGYKSGIGTASRALEEDGHTVGVLTVPNFGFAKDLIIAGVPVGQRLETESPPPERGSCIFVVGTDAPVDAGALRRLAARCFMGMARTGAISGVTSGDIAVAFTTARGVAARERDQDRELMNRLFRAAVECAEESILDALVGAVTTTGRDGHTISALPVAETFTLLRRLQAPGLME